MTDTDPIRQSFPNWLFNALGLLYAILLPMAGLICFLLALILVLRGKGPMVAVALVLIVHVPLLIGVFAAVQGLTASYHIMATSPMTPRPSEVAAGISMALAASMVGMVLMVPGYATAALGAIIRSIVPGWCAKVAKSLTNKAVHRSGRPSRS